MKLSHIIIQAGGKGTRLKKLTRNKPKPLVPVDNLPIMFHLFKKFPDAKFIIVGDYKYEVMRNYLSAFAQVDYVLIDGRAGTGTCAGLLSALEKVPSRTPFMLIWGDLILPEDFDAPDDSGGCYLGISKDFVCRWSYDDGVFTEAPSSSCGVAGLFLFNDKQHLEQVPESGEFVRWLAQSRIQFETIPLYGTKEYGIYDEIKKLPVQKCRPFNRITIHEDILIKEGIDGQGRELAAKEVAWYRKLIDANFNNLPKIYGFSPLKMELVDGKNIYEYEGLGFEQRKQILEQVITCLDGIHSRESIEPNYQSFYDAYIGKTYKRLEKVYELVPFAKDDVIVVNGIECPNPFNERERISEIIDSYYPNEFKLIHGDCTFSNMMLRSDGTPVLIDPRGYFGSTQFYGDPAYDWGKLYYSLVGNYDQFNLKRFDLAIHEDGASLSIKTNGWEDLEDYFFELLHEDVTREQIKMMHAIIWLSLTTYAWEDYDSICGAFYNGCRYLREAL